MSSNNNNNNASEEEGSKQPLELMSEEDCALCLQCMSLAVELPGCKHRFCYICIKGVAIRHQPCPLCRGPLSMRTLRHVTTTADRNIPGPSLEHPVQVDQKPFFVVTQSSDQQASSSVIQSPTSSVPTHSVYWLYEGSNDSWWRYDLRHERNLEMAHERGETAAQLTIMGVTYEVDLTAMLQYPSGRPNRSRAVRRVATLDEYERMNVHGIAGVFWAAAQGRQQQQPTSSSHNHQHNRRHRRRRSAIQAGPLLLVSPQASDDDAEDADDGDEQQAPPQQDKENEPRQNNDDGLEQQQQPPEKRVKTETVDKEEEEEERQKPPQPQQPPPPPSMATVKTETVEEQEQGVQNQPMCPSSSSIALLVKPEPVAEN